MFLVSNQNTACSDSSLWCSALFSFSDASLPKIQVSAFISTAHQQMKQPLTLWHRTLNYKPVNLSFLPCCAGCHDSHAARSVASSTPAIEIGQLAEIHLSTADCFKDLYIYIIYLFERITIYHTFCHFYCYISFLTGDTGLDFGHYVVCFFNSQKIFYRPSCRCQGKSLT